MKALLISDCDFKTAQYNELHARLCAYLEQKNLDVEEISVGQGEIAYCKGCFGCWMKTPGECVIKDSIGEINRVSINADAVFYLSPVVFGQFSPNITNIINRWLPNMLPFFTKRQNGSTMHPPRYKCYPAHVMLGYGDALTDEDAQLFMDINHKHRSNVFAFVYQMDMDIALQLSGINLARTGGSL
jgi:multimeric flavodoxin WrbA